MKLKLLTTDLLILAAFAVPLGFRACETDAPSVMDVANLMADTCGVLVGFILTAISVLASINDRPFVQRTKTTGHYGALLAELGHASLWLGVTCVVSITLLYLPHSTQLWASVFASSAFFAGAFRMARSLFMFFRFMQNL